MYSDSKVGKFIVFKIADYLLALEIGDVLKVVNFSPEVNKGLIKTGLVQLGRHTIRVLDLHQYLLGTQWHFRATVSAALTTSNSALRQIADLSFGSANQPFFLVITRDQEGELWGISVTEPPDLMEIPHQMIRYLATNRDAPVLLKSSSRSKSILEMSSYAAVVSQENITTTVFLLDINRVLNSLIYDSHAHALKTNSIQ